jgi:hypothetical protein
MPKPTTAAVPPERSPTAKTARRKGTLSTSRTLSRKGLPGAAS